MLLSTRYLLIALLLLFVLFCCNPNNLVSALKPIEVVPPTDYWDNRAMLLLMPLAAKRRMQDKGRGKILVRNMQSIQFIEFLIYRSLMREDLKPRKPKLSWQE